MSENRSHRSDMGLVRDQSFAVTRSWLQFRSCPCERSATVDYGAGFDAAHFVAFENCDHEAGSSSAIARKYLDGEQIPVPITQQIPVPIAQSSALATSYACSLI